MVSREGRDDFNFAMWMGVLIIVSFAVWMANRYLELRWSIPPLAVVLGIMKKVGPAYLISINLFAAATGKLPLPPTHKSRIMTRVGELCATSGVTAILAVWIWHMAYRDLHVAMNVPEISLMALVIGNLLGAGSVILGFHVLKEAAKVDLDLSRARFKG